MSMLRTKLRRYSLSSHLLCRQLDTHGSASMSSLAPLFCFRCSKMKRLTCTSRYKAFLLVGLHPGCAIILSVGYALREYGSFNYLYSHENLVVFICSQIFIYICPWVLPLSPSAGAAQTLKPRCDINALDPLSNSQITTSSVESCTTSPISRRCGQPLLCAPLAVPWQSSKHSTVWGSPSLPTPPRRHLS